MSSILKALKKLEHDKAVRRPDTFRIDADILQGTPPRSSSSMRVIAAAIAIFSCGVTATYIYMQPTRQPAAGKPPRVSINEGTVGPATAIVPHVDAPPTGEKGTRPAEERSRRSEQVIPVAEKTPFPPRQTDRYRRTDPVEAVPRDLPPEPKPVSSPATPATAALPAKPLLKVHGIAFQDGADSMAVINGKTVSNGSMIEGVRVEEILKDRVRFSRGGERFEIILDKSD